MNKKLNKKIFAKFFWDIATDEEKKNVYDSNESIEMLNEQWDEYSDMKKADQINHQKITRNINQNLVTHKNKQNSYRRLGSYLRKHAASFIIPLLAVGTLYFLLIMRPGMIHNMSMVEKYNPKGQRTELILPDGSKVWLNAETKITYPEKFIGKYRTVYLEGEAFFDVIKNPKKPFIVKTNKLDIEVLGTSFNVMSYAEDKIVETTLVTGKVSVKRFNPKTQKTQKAILTPNHQAVFYKDQERFVLDQVDVKKYTLWRKGTIIFDNEPFEQMANVLERWYDVDFVIEEKLGSKYNYTMTVTEESLEEVLQLIKKTTPDLNIHKKENVVEITMN